jgi:hypothetical protein
LSRFLWWNDIDYIKFKNEAIYDLMLFISLNKNRNLNSTSAQRELYQNDININFNEEEKDENIEKYDKKEKCLYIEENEDEENNIENEDYDELVLEIKNNKILENILQLPTSPQYVSSNNDEPKLLSQYIIEEDKDNSTEIICCPDVISYHYKENDKDLRIQM